MGGCEMNLMRLLIKGAIAIVAVIAIVALALIIVFTD